MRAKLYLSQRHRPLKEKHYDLMTGHPKQPGHVPPSENEGVYNKALLLRKTNKPFISS